MLKTSEKNLSKSPVNSKYCWEVATLKVLILLVVLLIPLIWMLLDVTKSRKITYLNNSQAQEKANKPGDKYNFEIPVPQSNVDIEAVPKSEIDTLFSNLK